MYIIISGLYIIYIMFRPTNSSESNLFTIRAFLGNGSALTGIKLVKDYWKKNGLNTEELYLVDGSGLSRENTLTTNFQANLLVKIYFDKIWEGIHQIVITVSPRQMAGFRMAHRMQSGFTKVTA